MEFFGRQKTVALLAFAAFLAGWTAPRLSGQVVTQFYDVDKETEVEGTIQDVLFEPRYENRAQFLVVSLEEKGTSRQIRIEISPAWFFEQDLHRGERLKVVGSLYGPRTGPPNIIAREIQFRGEKITVRDKRGFPNWSGGQHGERRRRDKRI